MHDHSHDHSHHYARAGEPAANGAALQPIRLTEKAIEMVREALRRENVVGHALRVSVVGGGCSGFQYQLAFEPEAKPDDSVLEYGEVRVLVDPASQRYLNGVVIDYVQSLHGAGFKFVNPNAQRTCGCGSSFSA